MIFFIKDQWDTHCGLQQFSIWLILFCFCCCFLHWIVLYIVSWIASSCIFSMADCCFPLIYPNHSSLHLIMISSCIVYHHTSMSVLIVISWRQRCTFLRICIDDMPSSWSRIESIDSFKCDKSFNYYLYSKLMTK